MTIAEDLKADLLGVKSSLLYGQNFNVKVDENRFAIILMGKRGLIALLNLSSWCLVMVKRLFLAVPWGCLQFVIVVFPDHTHYFICFPLLLDAVVLSGISSGMTAHKLCSFYIAFVMKLCVAHQSRWPITWSA